MARLHHGVIKRGKSWSYVIRVTDPLGHIHATTLLLAHEPVHVVAARLGHAYPSVTLRVYARVIHEQAAAVAGTFARVLEEAAKGSESGPVSTGVSKVPEADASPGRQEAVD